MAGGEGQTQNGAMPFAPHTEDQPRRAARSQVSSLRRSRDDIEETREQSPAGPLEDGERDIPSIPRAPGPEG
jgi:hypothetical protein